MHFVTKLRPHFWNLRKITDFLIPIKSYFEKKISDLIKWVWLNFFLTKTSLERKLLKIIKNVLYILVLASQPESIFGWARCRFQNHSTLVYSIPSNASPPPGHSGINTIHFILYNHQKDSYFLFIYFIKSKNKPNCKLRCAINKKGVGGKDAQQGRGKYVLYTVY